MFKQDDAAQADFRKWWEDLLERSLDQLAAKVINGSRRMHDYDL